jgi:hypothetical protein
LRSPQQETSPESGAGSPLPPLPALPPLPIPGTLFIPHLVSCILQPRS